MKGGIYIPPELKKLTARYGYLTHVPHNGLDLKFPYERAIVTVKGINNSYL